MALQYLSSGEMFPESESSSDHEGRFVKQTKDVTTSTTPSSMQREEQ